MFTRVLLRFLALYLTFETVLCIFYTDSKENDFPRIGKRKNMFIPQQLWTDENGDVERKTVDLPQGSTTDKLGYSSVSPTLYFKLFDKDGDGFVSQQEFYISWNKEVRRLIKSIYELE